LTPVCNAIPGLLRITRARPVLKRARSARVLGQRGSSTLTHASRAAGLALQGTAPVRAFAR